MKSTPLTILLILAIALAPTPALLGQPIVQSRGLDSRVDYALLADYGPWDDRNYQLTRKDLELLAKNALERRPGVPLFYRIELLRERPDLRDPARRFPRSAFNKFIGKYGGFLVDGKLYRDVEVVGGVIRVDPERGVAQEDFEEHGFDAFAKANGWQERVFRPGAETAVKFKPGSSTVAVAGVNDANFGQTMAFTTNGGNSWSIANGANPFNDSCCDPTVDWSANGNKAYTATLQGSAPGDVFVYRSRNNGRTWTDLPGNSRTELGESGSDKEYLHVDKHPGSPFVNRIYLCWHVDNVQRFAFSSDQAVSFSKKNVSGGRSQLGIGCDLTTDKNGNVYYFWPAFNSRRILVRKSANGGGNFQAVKRISRTHASFDFPIPAMQQRNAFVYVSAAADLTDGPFANTIYAAWTDSTARTGGQANQNHARIRVAFSRNGGATWAARTPHPTNDRNSVDRFHPWLAVDPDGVVHVMYYDTGRSNNRRAVDVFHAFSTNGGRTWQRERVTNQLSQRVNDGFQFGDYNGLDAEGTRLLATWTATRNGAAVGRSGRKNN